MAKTYDYGALGRTRPIKGINTARMLKEDRLQALVVERAHSPNHFGHTEKFTDSDGPQYISYHYPQEDASAGLIAVDDIMYTAPDAVRVVSITGTPLVAGTGGACTAQIRRLQGTEAPSAGDVLHSGTFDIEGTANTVQDLTLTATTALLLLEDGNRLGFDVTGTATAAVGNITVGVVPYPNIGGNWEVVGTNSDAAGIEQLAGGGLRLETAGADGDEHILQTRTFPQSHLNGIWNTANEPFYYANIVTGPDAADITSAIIWGGWKLTNTETTATDADQAFFRFEDDVNSGRWQAITSIAGTDIAVDTGITVAAATRYELAVALDAERRAHFWVRVDDGTARQVAVSEAMTSLTTIDPFLGVAADGAAEAKELDVRCVHVSQNYT